MRERNLAQRAALLVAAAAVAFYLAWELAHRGTYGYATSIYPIDDADEWRYTACSRLVAHGYRLFDQVFSAQPPLLFVSLAAVMRTFGMSIDGARALEVLAGLVSLVAAGAIALRLRGSPAAGGAMLVLAVSPAFLVYSHAVEAEGPMMAAGTLSLALLLWGLDVDWLWLVAVAGLALAAAVLFKLFAVALILPAGWLLLSAPLATRRRLRLAAVFAVCAGLPTALDFLLVSPGAQWRQVIAMHNAAAAVHLAGATPAPRVLLDFFTLDLGLTLLAVAGLAIVALRGRRRELVFLLLWLPAQAIMLLAFRPLFPHHPAILSTALAVPAGLAIAEIAELARWRQDRMAWLGAAAGVLYLALAVRIAHDDRHLLVDVANVTEVERSHFVAEHSRPGQFVVTDDVRLAEVAGREVPPPLCDPSNVRFVSGYLSARELIGATARYHAALVMPVGVYTEIPAYLRWLRSHGTRTVAPYGATAYLMR